MVAWEELEKAGTTWADLSGVTWAELEETCEKGSSNIAQKDLEDRDGEYPIYGASGFIKNVDFYQQETPYIAVVKDGAGVGRVMRLPAKSSVIGTMQYILPKNNVDTGYLAYALEHMNLSKYYTGATIPHIYFKDYKKEKFPLPPLDEQRRITAVLDKVSGLIAKRREQLDKLDELVKARFVEMFGDPSANSQWTTQKLSKLGELNRGVSKHRPRNDPALLGGPYPLIQTGDVSNSGLYILDYSSTYSELGLAQSRLWKEGTLCITIAANIAQTSILAFDACFPDSVVGFLPGEKTNAVFVHYWFSFFQKILEEQAPQVAQKNINLKILSDLDVIVPPYNLQADFSDFVRQAEKSKLTIHQSLDKLEVLKKALMQQYFG